MRHDLLPLLALWAALPGCERKSVWGESCAYTDHCEEALACYRSKCAPVNGDRQVVDPKGDSYDGVFEGGAFLRGHVRLKGGGHLQGRFEKGKLIEGERRDADGQRAVGKFRGGKLIEGQLHEVNGTLSEGDFGENGFLNGRRARADGTVEEGAFFHGRLQKGKLTLPDGRRLEGEFDEQGRLDCESCASVAPDGRVTTGTYRHGEVHGKVTVRRPDGSTLRGMLVQGRIAGKGSRTDADGARFAGWRLDADGHFTVLP